MASDFRALVKSGKELIGIFIKTPNYQLVEIVSSCNLSFIVLDAEHAPFDRSELDTSIMAAKSSSIPVMVRVPKSSDEYILNALDQGADGVLVPHINSIDDAKDVISFAKYRDANFPLGKRGFSNSSRSGNYGSLSLSKMIDKANNKTALICQIEEKQAVDNIDDIVSQEGIDCLFIGTADLAVSLDCVDINDSRVINSIDRVVIAAKKANITLGIYLSDSRAIDTWRDKGFSLFIIGSDQTLLKSALKNLTEQLN
jgi:2-keto-3-deoxy-L-rhamnonate aldolase RhmA